MKLLRSLGGALSIALIMGLLAVAVPAGAQTLTALTMERVLTATSIQSSLTSNLPPSTLASIASGALEIHEQTNYNAQANTLTSTFFLEPAGTAPPVNLGTVPASSILAIVALTADKTYVTSSAVQFVGSITQSNTPLLGTASYLAAPATVSFGYTTDTPPKIHDVIETVAGVGSVYTATATGTVAITQPSTGGGGGGGGSSPITILVNGPGGANSTNTFVVTGNQVTLDASGSTSTNAGALTYAWAVAQTSPSAVISYPGGATAMPLIQLVGGRQPYTITLTVTDATGATATATITVNYI
jgi:K319-like protein